MKLPDLMAYSDAYRVEGDEEIRIIKFAQEENQSIEKWLLEKYPNRYFKYVPASRVERLEAENKKLRDALEFYAKGKHLVQSDHDVGVHFLGGPEDHFVGKRAREALGSECDEQAKPSGGEGNDA